MNIETELAVIGAGPAGLAAAIEAAKAGIDVALYDENDREGGQLAKQIHKFFGSKEHWSGIRGYDIGSKLFYEAQSVGVKISLSTHLWGIFDNNELAVNNDKRTMAVKAEKVIIATGALERPLAFPGCTLPGIMGAGAAQTMVNIHRVLPGRNVLIVGSGNVGLIVAYQLMIAGAHVVAIVESKCRIGGYHVHAAKMRRAGVPILVSHALSEAMGTDKVEGAKIIRLGSENSPLKLERKNFSVDLICLAVGLSPCTKLCWLAGCEFAYSTDLGGFVPLHDDNMETSVNGLYVAGDVAGVEEASIAIEEGRLAGLSVVEALGYYSKKEEVLERKNAIRDRLSVLRGDSPDNSFRKGNHELPRDQFKSASIHSSTFREAGVIPTNLLENLPNYPTQARFKKGPVAVIECLEKIPCNPCESACPNEAIIVGDPITNLPRLIEEKCTGCGLCVPICPGLAVFTVNNAYSNHEATVSFPYEYFPLPEEDSVVNAVDREGRIICRGKVIKVKNPPENDHTAVLTIAVPKKYSSEVRGIEDKSIRRHLVS